MDKKSKILFLILGILIAGSVAITYYKFMVKLDYVVEEQTDCDPAIDKCFVWECDPAAVEEGEKCTGDPENDIWYYQLARRNAGNIPLCDPNQDEGCDPLACDTAAEKDCAVIFCDDATKEEQGAECSDPVQYNIDNPEDSSDIEASEDEFYDAEVPTDESAAEAIEGDGSVCEEGSADCEVLPRDVIENTSSSTDAIDPESPAEDVDETEAGPVLEL